MIVRKGVLASVAVFAAGLAACSPSAVSEPTDAPATAQSRADVEKIVRAYLLEHPEVIVEAMDVLTERENANISKLLSGDSRDVSVGPEDAPVTIVEFFDYKCGYCKRSLDWVMDTVQNSDGKVRVVFKELPILSEQSRQASLAALAANRQGKYMEFHQKLMRFPSALTDDAIDDLAADLGLNVTKMRKDMTDPKILEHVQDVRDQAREYGADATPSFFINGELIQGYDKPQLEARIKTLLE